MPDYPPTPLAAHHPCLICGGRKPTGVLEVCSSCLPVICPHGLPDYAVNVIKAAVDNRVRPLMTVVH